MKTKFKNFTQIALMLFVFFISYSCKKDNNATTNPLINVTVTDFDGNVYNTITIGTQTWMAENLKVKHYRNGEAITNVKDNTDWGNLSTGAYCDVNDTSSYCATYGLLYNWYTVVDSRNLCPTGWHIPSSDEWTTLTTYLGGDNIAGDKLKEVGNAHWTSPSTAATNETGFTALPAGCRNDLGIFQDIGIGGNWWSSIDYSTQQAWYLEMYNCYSYARINRYTKQYGYSVRCIKNY